MILKKNIWLLGFVIVYWQANAQNFSNNVSIDTVTVSKQKKYSFQDKIEIEKIPSVPSKAIANTLQIQSDFYIKSYGKGQLASISHKGFGAPHTNILWNGVKLNSPMLAQADLNLISLGSNDFIAFDNNNYDNLAGKIDLQKNISYNIKNELNLAASVGSFAHSTGNISYLFSKKKFFTQSLVSYQAAKNNFSYQNPSLPAGTKSKQKNAEAKKVNIEQVFGFKLNARNQIKLFAKYFYADRNIAPSLFETNASENQKDQLALGKVEWYHNYRNVESQFSSSFVLQNLDYRFSPSSSVSKNFTTSWQSNYKLNYGIKKHFKFHLDLHNNLETAKSSNYTELKKRNQLHLGSDAVYTIDYFESSLGFTQILVDGKLMPFLPRASLGFKIKNLPADLFIQANYSAKLRIPSFNDLYWTPGGNSSLKAETSHNISIYLVLKRKMNKVRFQNKLEYFGAWAKNYIQWQPSTNGYWEAKNIGEIINRGFSNKLNIAYQAHKNIALDFGLGYTFTKSNKIKENNQLIYVPYDKLNFLSKLKTKWFYLHINQQYTSKRFVNATNTQSLKPFYLLDIYAGHQFSFKNKDQLAIGLALNNVTNQSYFLSLNQPLPRFHFEISLNYKLNFIK